VNFDSYAGEEGFVTKTSEISHTRSRNEKLKSEGGHGFQAVC
jgi:hypothetical protein